MPHFPFEDTPERRPERIDLLMSLLLEDWRRTGQDQRFFQYIANLQHRVGTGDDAWNFEDAALIAALQEFLRQPPAPPCS